MSICFLGPRVDDHDFVAVVDQIRIDIGRISLESQFGAEMDLGSLRVLGRDGGNS